MAEENENKNKASEQAASPSPKKKHKKGMIVGIVVVVVVVLGVGFWTWHNTPGFCGNVCHDTMYEHLANYEGTDDSNGAGLAHVHAAAGVGCLDCHEADIETQVSEAYDQVFDNPGSVDLTSTYYVANDKCLSCHGGSYDKLAEMTASLGDYNPHNSPHGQMNCNECHKGHSSQVDLCGECHTNGGQVMRG